MIIRSVRNISWFLRTDKTLSTTLYFFFTLFSRRWRSHNKVCGRSESKFFITTENRYQCTLRVIYLYVQRWLSKTKVQLWSELEHILELHLQFAGLCVNICIACFFYLLILCTSWIWFANSHHVLLHCSWCPSCRWVIDDLCSSSLLGFRRLSGLRLIWTLFHVIFK